MFWLELIIDGEVIFKKEFDFKVFKNANKYVQSIDLFKVIEAYENLTKIKAKNFKLLLTPKIIE